MHHFAHRPGSDCVNAGESPAHLSMKMNVWEQQRGLASIRRCELEWPIANRRADVWVETTDGESIAVECQISAYEGEHIAAKLADYKAARCRALYLVHAKAIPGYIAAYGMASLHGREIFVPAWVHELALLDPAYGRTASFDMMTGESIPQHTFIHFWDRGSVWIARLEPIWRDRWDKSGSIAFDYVPLQRKRLIRIAAKMEVRNGIVPFTHPALSPPSTHACLAGYIDCGAATHGAG